MQRAADARREFITNALVDLLVPYIDNKFARMHKRCVQKIKSMKLQIHPLRLFQDYLASLVPGWKTGVEFKNEIEHQYSKGHMLDRLITQRILYDFKVYNIRIHNIVNNTQLRIDFVLGLMKEVARALYMNVGTMELPRKDRERVYAGIVTQQLDKIIPLDLFVKAAAEPVDTPPGSADKSDSDIDTVKDSGSQIVWDMIDRDNINSYVKPQDPATVEPVAATKPSA